MGMGNIPKQMVRYNLMEGDLYIGKFKNGLKHGPGT